MLLTLFDSNNITIAISYRLTWLHRPWHPTVD